jgi:hypothetical protein
VNPPDSHAVIGVSERHFYRKGAWKYTIHNIYICSASDIDTNSSTDNIEAYESGRRSYKNVIPKLTPSYELKYHLIYLFICG